MKDLGFSINEKGPNKYVFEINIGSNFIDSVYRQSVISQKKLATTYGFTVGSAPATYIEQNYKAPIVQHLKELFFKHCVIDYLINNLIEKNIILAEEPKINRINLFPESNGIYEFEISNIKLNKKKYWRDLLFKAPVRKNYKDLDRQVESFIKEELSNWEKNPEEQIRLRDWVCFDLTICDDDKKPLLENYKQNLWIKIGEEEADLYLHELFLGKNYNEKFYSTNKVLQDYVCSDLNIGYNFLVEIKDVIPYIYFNFEHFKKHFKIKTGKEVEAKLIEVFSYRNNFSLRRETVEAILALLLKNHLVEIPGYILRDQQEQLLEKLHDNPDYHVYKAKNDFKEKVKMLAEKQLKEKMIIDSIAYSENIKVNHNDIAQYINFLQRPRTKDFIYFEIPSTKIDNLETPISTEVIRQYCLREKTLNHIINYLTGRQHNNNE
ncbi:hypothetical protein M1446_02440 [Candidatus Dependentiae bacterium]|nr:hypothetical protein [Candidatus Dependentiae bacterium]